MAPPTSMSTVISAGLQFTNSNTNSVRLKQGVCLNEMYRAIYLEHVDALLRGQKLEPLLADNPVLGELVVRGEPRCEGEHNSSEHPYMTRFVILY